MKEDTETITVSKDKPYKRIMGYMADLNYPPGNAEFKKRRIGDRIITKGEGSETNKIVAINQNEVVLSMEPTGKRERARYISSGSTANTASNE
jgi:hypothetical protein